MIKLKGITGHGKNRIREHGELWEILELPPGVVSMSNKPALPPVKSVKPGVWRWLDEKNFEIEFTRYGNPKPESYDRADAIVIAKAGYKISQKNT